MLRLRPDALEWRQVEGEIVALDVRTHTYLGVNSTGASVWPALLEGATHEQLVDQLVERFGVDRSRAKTDLDAFLQGLREQDLLES